MTSRILFVEGNTDGTVGGSYYIMVDLVLGLDRSRYEPIVVFCDENIVAERLRKEGVRVLVIPPPRPLVFRARWLNIALAPLKRVVNTFRGFLLPALAQAQVLRRERIDMVNLNNSITINHSWMVASRLAGIPCITHEMGMVDSYTLRARYLGARLDAVICLSRAIHDDMRRLGVDLPNAVVIHSLFNPKRYVHAETPEALRAQWGIPPGAPIVGVVGNVKKWKGQETIVRATHLLRDCHPELRCVLAGGSSPSDMPYREHLEALCRDLGIEKRVIFAGFQPNAIDYMRLMDVVVHTSTSPEPFGIVLLEAMLLGKPLITTTIGGPAEIVLDGETGLLVDPGQPELLAGAIDRMLSDPAVAAAMGRKGKERLASEFALERTLGETTAIYDRVLSARRGPRPGAGARAT